LVDRHGTIITVEALHDWWEGFQQHRIVILQHNLRELRSIKGKPMVGVATRIDFYSPHTRGCTAPGRAAEFGGEQVGANEPP
jgi:hypothetical protein